MSLTISAAQVASFIANPSSFTGYAANSHVIVNGLITPAQATQLNGVDATYIQATIQQSSAADLIAIQTNNATRTATNKYTVSTSDTTASAATLNSVKAMTSVTPDFSSVTGITASSASDITSLYSGTNTSLGNETISVNDTTVDATALDLINSKTTGMVTSTATTVSGPVAKLQSVLEATDPLTANGGAAAASITLAADIAVTVTDTSVTAAALAALENDADDAGQQDAAHYTTGVITVNSPTIVGTHTELTALVAAPFNTTPPRFSGVTNKNLTLDNTATAGTQSFTADNIRAVQDIVTAGGTVTATCSEVAIADLVALKPDTNHNITIGAITNATIADAAQLVAVDSATSQTLTFAAATVTLSGSASEINSVFSSSGIDFTTAGLGDAIVNIDAGNTSVAVANLVNSKTTGVITHSGTGRITETSMSALAGLNAATGAAANAYDILVSDAEIDAAALKALLGKTSGANGVTLQAATKITGSLDDVHNIHVTNAANIANETDKTIVLTDTGALDVVKVMLVDAVNTAGTITASNATSLVGTTDAVIAAIDSARVTVPTTVPVSIKSETITIFGNATAGGVDSADLIAISGREVAHSGATLAGKTTGLVTLASDVTYVEGSENELLDVFEINTPAVTDPVTPSRIQGLETKDVAVTSYATGTALSSAERILFQNYTSGVVTASLGSGALSAFVNATTGAVEFESGNAFSFTLTDATLSAAQLKNLLAASAATTGTITLASSAAGKTTPAITGTAADLAAYYADAGIAVKGAATNPVTISDAAISAADLKAINVGTLGTAANGVQAGNVTSITGALADLQHSFTGEAQNPKEITGGITSAAVTITDIVVDAENLSTFTSANGAAAETSGAINVLSPTIEGGFTAVNAMLGVYGTGRFVGLDNANVNLTSEGAAPTAANVNTLAALTTGTITATISDSLGDFITGLNGNVLTDALETHNLTLTVTDAQVNAGQLKTLNASTTGAINLANVTSVAGTAADILAAYADTTGVTNLDGNEAIIVTGAPTVAQINDLITKTSGTVTSTITGDMASLNTITGSTNTFNIVVTDSVVQATELAALVGKTSGTVTLPAVCSIAGTLAEVNSVITTAATVAKISGIDTAGVTISDPVDGAQVRAIIGLTSIADGTITATISSTYWDQVDADGNAIGLNRINRAGAYTINVAGDTQGRTGTPAVESITADNIVSLNAITTVPVNVTSSLMTSAHGAIADVTNTFIAAGLGPNATAATIANPTVTGINAIAVTIAPAGAITVAQGNEVALGTTGLVTANLATGALSTFINATTDVIAFESGNAFSFSVNNASFTAANTAQLALLDAATSAGTITLSGITGGQAIAGSLEDLTKVFNSFNLTGDAGAIEWTGNPVITINDTPNVAKGITAILSAAEVNAIDAKTTGAVTITNPGGITGTIDDVTTFLGSGGITDNLLAADTVVVTDSMTVAQANVIDATAAPITGTISTGNLTGTNALDDIGEANNYTITVTDTVADAVALNDVNALTTGLITVNSGSVSGIQTEVLAALSTATTEIAGLGAINATVTDNTLTVAQVNAVELKTTGAITHTGTISDTDMATLSTLAGTGNSYNITVANTSASVPTVDAGALKTLNGKVTAPVAVTATNITGFLSDVKAIYDANTAGEITGLGNEVVTLTDAGSVNAADLDAVNRLTTGVLTANAVQVVTGSVVDLLKVYSSGNSAGVIAGLGNESVIVTDTGTVAAADITTLDGLTSGSITATGVTKLTGSVTEVTAARSAATVTGVTSLALTGSTETFDATSYLASNADLITAFGNAPASAITHYLAFGVNESRNLDSFDEKSYLASHADLMTAFGSDTAKATDHYISNGYTENRAVDTFDEFGYVASYSDLITALGADANAAVDHYINFGFGESRSSTFDASSYLAANADLQAAFGSDLEAAKKHYINHGASENRLLA